jgi:hypothetical protein
MGRISFPEPAIQSRPFAIIGFGCKPLQIFSVAAAHRPPPSGLVSFVSRGMMKSVVRAKMVRFRASMVSISLDRVLVVATISPIDVRSAGKLFLQPCAGGGKGAVNPHGQACAHDRGAT